MPRVMFALLAASALCAQPDAGRKKVLLVAQTKGYQHESVSTGLAAFFNLGRESGLWDAVLRTDTQLVTKKMAGHRNLDAFDAVVFYTTGELDLDAEQKAALLAFVRDDGKGFLGVHSAVDTFYGWPEYGELIGAYFDGHPWNVFPARVIVEDRAHPATRHLPPAFEIRDEIYQMRNFSRDRVRVLARLDETRVDLKKNGVKRTDGDFPLAWVREYGKGRVFYSAFGHTEESWADPGIRKMLVEAMRWALRLSEGDATPRARP
jgi:type 1 glutamine amidotransferase